VNWAPTNGQSYGTGSQGANEIIYVGSLQTATHSGITAGNSYHYALYAYNANDFYSATPVTISVDTGAIDCSSLAGGTWVAVPGDADYGTSDFCVMKYEAKEVGGVATSQATGNPWVSISQTNSITECSDLGGDYHLITNNEWMTIAANIANVADNWSGGSVGSGSLNRGHTDGSPNNALAADANDNNACSGTGQTCDGSTWNLERRTFKLSTGEVIWDFGGNVWEWTSYYEPSGKATPTGFSYNEYPTVGDGATTTKAMLVPTNAVKSWWNDSWDSTYGIGQYYAGTNGSGGALVRGGGWYSDAVAGVFTAVLDSAPSHTNTGRGLRCAAFAP
jgi:hypothetical protein